MVEYERPSLDDPNAWVPYRYHPSRTAAIIFVVAFALTTLIHSAQVVRRKTWYFIPLVVGGLFETVGFVGRILSTNDLWTLGPFIIQSLLLLLAPALFAASIYIILGRIILLVDGERYSLIRQKWLTKVFVTGDVISFCVQMGGGGIQAAGTLELLHAGEKVIIVGLFLQLAFFGFFVVVAGLWHWRIARAEVKESGSECDLSDGGQRARRRIDAEAGSGFPDTILKSVVWKRHLYTLYVASGLIMFRSVFRVVEYVQGNNGYLLRHEYFLYVFDALLMFVVMVLFNFVHPAQITEQYQQRLADERGMMMEEAGSKAVGEKAVCGSKGFKATKSPRKAIR
ncbi:RTA1 like protein-domain-containing protein [Dendryphion nanum]|uniref:RTA1 like protein-domain-containing protein n=1 Tax=Dendryphion nanum TaxID=256645 RepID=A0A9P9IPC8_9PLEO|nr:RTA1 like protein-domain-containing protein [Dendryphion nanum]